MKRFRTSMITLAQNLRWFFFQSICISSLLYSCARLGFPKADASITLYHSYCMDSKIKYYESNQFRYFCIDSLICLQIWLLPCACLPDMWCAAQQIPLRTLMSNVMEQITILKLHKIDWNVRILNFEFSFNLLYIYKLVDYQCQIKM